MKLDPHHPARVISRFESGSVRPIQGGVTAQYPYACPMRGDECVEVGTFDKRGFLLLLKCVHIQAYTSAVEGTALGGSPPLGDDSSRVNV